MAAAASPSDSAGGGGGVRVRSATRADIPHVHQMILELAAFEGVPDGPQLSVADLIEDAFDSTPPWCFLLVAEAPVAGGELVGYALANRAYSSWTRRALYLEDLYVRPAARHRRVGFLLLATLCQMGEALGVQRIDWHVLESNEVARAFYARAGARCLRETEGRAALRLDAPHIRRLATAAAAAAAPAPLDAAPAPLDAAPAPHDAG